MIRVWVQPLDTQPSQDTSIILSTSLSWRLSGLERPQMGLESLCQMQDPHFHPSVGGHLASDRTPREAMTTLCAGAPHPISGRCAPQTVSM